MQDKYEMEQFTPQFKIEIAKDLSITDIVNTALTSKNNLKFFKPIADVCKFLHQVTRCDHEAVKAILKKDTSLFDRKGQITDCSGRTFETISGFEYALWALDKHMWTTILGCLPKNEEGIALLKLLNRQYDDLNKNGIIYRLNGQPINEKHFDLENTLIKELQTQANLVNSPGPTNWDAIYKHWQEKVGGVQNELPMHFVHEYCSNEPFYPIPKFIVRPNSSTQFYNCTTNKKEDWFKIDSKIGSEIAIHKGEQAAFGVRNGPHWRAGCSYDLNAMRALCDRRTLDFTKLKLQLEKETSLDNHQQIVPLM